MEKHFPDNVEIVATHPMFGPDSARNGLAGLPMVICPVRCDEQRLHSWEVFFKGLGLDVKRMSTGEHDREAAYTQGITHFIGRVLADLNLKPSHIATLGYRRLLTIIEQTCNDSWQLFMDLQQYNPYTEEMREQLQRSLDTIMDKINTLDSSEGRQ
jgi:prephenate dehydrogenase